MRPFRLYLVALTCATVLVAGVELAPHRAPRTEDGLPRLSVLLAEVDMVPQRTRVLGYERSEFGAGWAPVPAPAGSPTEPPTTGCTVREHILLTQLADAAVSGDGCRVTAGHGTDPYTGEDIRAGPAAGPVEIDHLLPLSAAWDLGAHTWDSSTRLAFANDPVNLVVTSREANREKSDQLPAAWLPPDRGARCWYSRRLALVAAHYSLPLPREDVTVMRSSCRVGQLLGGD